MSNIIADQLQGIITSQVFTDELEQQLIAAIEEIGKLEEDKKHLSRLLEQQQGYSNILRDQISEYEKLTAQLYKKICELDP